MSVFGALSLVSSAAASLIRFYRAVPGLEADETDSSLNPFKLPIGGEVVPLLPGVNLPLADVFYMWPALVIVFCVHEVGHACAAWTEGVPVEGFGVFAALSFRGRMRRCTNRFAVFLHLHS